MTIEKIKRELKQTLRFYKKINLIKNDKLNDIKEGNLVRLNTFPYTIYLLIAREYQFDKESRTFKCLVFTEDIELATLTPKTPIIILNKERTIIAGLPIWIYCDESILSNYTTSVGYLNEKQIKEALDYAEKTPIPKTPQGKYIRTIASFIAPINTFSLFSLLDELEKSSEYEY